MQSNLRTDRRGLVTGVAHERVVAAGCAEVFKRTGARLASPGEGLPETRIFSGSPFICLARVF